MSYKSIYLRYMDKNEIKYVDRDDRTVRVTYGGDNLNSIPIYVTFDKDDKNQAQFSCWNIAKFPDNKLEQAYKICNDLNTEYRWVKFYIDSDKDIRCEMDACFEEYSVGANCASLVRRMVNIIDDVYPTFMKAMWG